MSASDRQRARELRLDEIRRRLAFARHIGSGGGVYLITTAADDVEFLLDALAAARREGAEQKREEDARICETLGKVRTLSFAEGAILNYVAGAIRAGSVEFIQGTRVLAPQTPETSQKGSKCRAGAAQGGSVPDPED